MSDPSGKPSITMLVSRISARGHAEQEGREAVRILRAAGWDVTIRLTDRMDHLPDTVKEQSARLIGAVGGDGYLTAVARGLAGNDNQIMVPFPGGRGNDLCRSLGIGTSSARRAAALVQASDLETRISSLDGMWVECADVPDRQLAIGVVSVGIDATANQIANRSWFRSGPMAYAWGALSAFVIQKFQDVTGTVDEVEHDFSGWLSSVSNTGWLGGGINLVPESDPTDGLLEVFNVERVSRLRAIPLLAKALGRGKLNSPLVHLYQGRVITLNCDHPLAAMADGDLMGHVPLTITAAPSVIRVML